MVEYQEVEEVCSELRNFDLDKLMVRLTRMGLAVTEDRKRVRGGIDYLHNDKHVLEHDDSSPRSKKWRYKGKTTDDEKEQEEIEESQEIRNQSIEQMINELKSLGPQTPEVVYFDGKRYKRDNKTITQIKILRNYKCQLCGYSILKKNGRKYAEAAHIARKSKKGPERPWNILILCPNHHKEFDLAKRRTIKHMHDEIIFELNGGQYAVDLRLDAKLIIPWQQQRRLKISRALKIKTKTGRKRALKWNFR